MFVILSTLLRREAWAYLDLDGFSQKPKDVEVECDEQNCGYFNESWPIVGSDSLDKCVGASIKPLSQFHRETGFLIFKAAVNVTLCREYVCAMYEQFFWAMRPNTDQGYYDGCDSFSDFNRTMCPTYPDVAGYCDCLWSRRNDYFPGMQSVLAENRDCWKPINNYLLVGRFLRLHPKMSTNRWFEDHLRLDVVCTRLMCQWFHTMSNPFTSVIAAERENADRYPAVCGDLNFPSVEQCMVMQELEPYHPCPWKEEPMNTDVDPKTMYCFAEQDCIPHEDGFSCCYPLGRMKCPVNLTLCEFPRNCGGNADSCCEEDCDERECCPLLVPWLAEWHGTVGSDSIQVVNITETEIETKPPPIDTDNFEYWLFLILGISLAGICCLVFLLWQFAFNRLALLDMKISRPPIALDMFAFTTFAAKIGRKVKRNLYNLPPLAEPEGVQNESITLFHKDLRKIAPQNEFREHPGLATTLDRRVAKELEKQEKKKKDMREKMKTNFDPSFQRKQDTVQRAVDETMERRIRTMDSASLDDAVEFYRELTGGGDGGASPSNKLVQQGLLATKKIINDADHPAEKLTLDRTQGTMKICPPGVTRLTGWFDADGGSVFVGDSLNEPSLPVQAPKPVCKHFQTGKCQRRQCPWLHQIAQKGDRLREPVGPNVKK